MDRVDTLTSLESLLESFLDKAVALKEDRLRVLDGINRLDDIARGFSTGADFTDEMGGWLAQHSEWLKSPGLRPADQNRIREILVSIKHELQQGTEVTPARVKISHEIDRISGTSGLPRQDQRSDQKLVLKRGAEQIKAAEEDTITLYANILTRLQAMFHDMSANKAHILTLLDDALKSARYQQNKDALLLSASIIYYLKLNRYKVDPYVKRLKEAEALFDGGEHA